MASEYMDEGVAIDLQQRRPAEIRALPRSANALTADAKRFAAQLAKIEDALVELPVPERVVVRVARRSIDVVVAALALLVLWPVILACAIAVKLDSSGPAFFRQVRLGRRGESFKILKLRGMYVDSTERFPELYDYTDQSRAIQFHFANDPRVTRVGRLFRRTSVDELPNFWNVVRGDMSLVGPRPQIPEMFEYYGDHARAILAVRPGIFSLPKVSLRDHLTLRETVLLDSYYVHARSFGFDLRVAFRGIVIVLLRRWVH